MPDSLGVVILAAGQGTRMKSQLHKVLHPLAGVPLIDHVLASARPLIPERCVLVIGHGAEQVRSHLGDSVLYSLQDPPRGTGDAVRTAREHLEGVAGTVLVLYGDTPLVSSETLQRLLEVHRSERPLVTILTGRTHDPGRVLRDASGRVAGVVEEKLASPEQIEITERNSGVCVFQAAWLWHELENLEISGTGEYLLTDLFARAVDAGNAHGGWPIAAVEVADPLEAMGINNRLQLAEAEEVLRRRLLSQLMLSGVTVVDPVTTYVHMGVQVGLDTTLLPGTHLLGRTTIGSGCTVGPGSYIIDSEVGDGCTVRYSMLEGTRMESGSDVGPYSHLRHGTQVESGAHLGNFVETKNTRIGAGSACGHFSYLGDADVGENVNIGAGTITANYNGTPQKQPTTIRAGAFIGVDTALVAPVEVGEEARTGAGSVITRDVPAGRTAVGVPARLVPPKATQQARAERARQGEKE